MMVMARTDLYFKVVLDHDDEETPERVAAEICRQIEGVYGVRAAELSNYVTRSRED
jgi:hypothetical protein